MHEYEIRILSAGHTVPLIEEVYLNDRAAIRSTRKLAGDKSFEVWRGLNCVYAMAEAGAKPNLGHSPSP